MTQSTIAYMSTAEQKEVINEYRDKLKAEGYDGILIRQTEYDYSTAGSANDQYVAFEPNQIKSATDNRGTFDGRNADITYSVIGRKALTWDRYVDRAFAGRDDGMWRAEIDASQAKLKMGALVGNAGAVYRKLVAGDDMPDKTRAALMQLREDKKVLDGWYAAMDKGEEYVDAYTKKYLAGDWLDRYQERSSLVQAYVRNTLLYAGVSGEGKYGSLAKGSRLVGTVFNSMLAGDVNEDLAKVLDTMSKKRNLPLGELLDYPELYEAYPELADVVVRYVGMETAYGRAVYGAGEEREILINRVLDGEWEKIHSVLLHEIQHHIQHIEGWAKGGNPAYARMFVDNRAATGDNQAKALRELSDMELYSRFAGEIEARNVQARRDWPLDKRDAIPFNSTLEYPGEALVTFSIQSIMTDCSLALDDFIQNPPVHKSAAWDSDVYVCPTPAVMKMVGALLLDMVMSHHVLAKVLDANTPLGNGQTTGQMYVKEKDMGKHHLTVDELRKLPLALANPVCIAESNRKGCVEVITDMEENGVNVLVAVQLDVASGSKYINVNRIASLYGKEKIEQLVKHPMLYVNTPKAYNWMVARGLQLPTRPNLIAGFNGKILSPVDLVKYKFQGKRIGVIAVQKAF